VNLLAIKCQKALLIACVLFGEAYDDITCAPNLVDIEVDGRVIKGEAQPTKQAFLYVFDRETGELVWPIVERPAPQGDVPGE